MFRKLNKFIAEVRTELGKATWPWDPKGSCDKNFNGDVGIVNSREKERLTLDSTTQIGLGLGRTLSDSA